jgi:hypothetical protein
VLKFRCPCCNTLMFVADDAAGRVIRCPQTSARVRVTGALPFDEQDWLAGADVSVLRKYLARRATRRKLRLFACACLRRLDHLLDERHRRALQAYERFADGFLSGAELVEEARSVRSDIAGLVRGRSRAEEANRGVAWLLQALQAPASSADAVRFAVAHCRIVAEWVGGWGLDAENKAQCDLFRDLFGNPFRPSPVRPEWTAWSGGTLARMAQNIYDERAFAELPVLADALEEAGCDDAQILSHCREPGEHVRGCWVLDALLGRA